MAQDITDFARLLDEADDPPGGRYEPSQEGKDVFDLPRSTKRLIDGAVRKRESSRVLSDYVDRGTSLLADALDPQQYIEIAKGPPSGVVKSVGLGLQGIDALGVHAQHSAHKHAPLRVRQQERPALSSWSARLRKRGDSEVGRGFRFRSTDLADARQRA